MRKLQERIIRERTSVLTTALYAATFIILSIGLSVQLKGQSSRKPEDIRGYIQTPFDASQDRLTPNFAGNDVGAIYKALIKIRPKGEYEKSSDYENRLKLVDAQRLYGSVLASSTIAVVMPEMDVFKEDQTVTWKYDADTEEMQAVVAVPDDKGVCEDCPATVVVEPHLIDTGTYSGRTAFGVHSAIVKHYFTGYGVTADPWPFDKEYTFPLSVAKAKAVRANLRVILVGHLWEPWTSHQDDFRLPTLDSPIDEDVKIHAVCFQPEKLWIADIRSGEIFRKVEGLSSGQDLPIKCGSDQLSKQ